MTAITETQDLVYRDAPPAVTAGAAPAMPAPAAQPAPDGPGPDDAGWTWRIDLDTDPTLLFRFSALTYNAHRIHYDRGWAIDEEGYPGLVVHGPLQAIGLAELCRRFAPEAVLASYAFRARRPAFDGPPLRLRGRPDDRGGAELAAFDQHGVPTLTAEVTFS
jgi:3-methylfumaryl-CoA hydratase